MTVQLVPVGGIPLIRPGADLVEVIWNACDSTGNRLRDGDVLAITGKIVSKSEGRFVDLRTVEPSDRAHRLARLTDKDPRLVELVLRESVEIIRARPGNLLVRHRLGYVSAVAGIDRSNVDGHDDTALLLPADPDHTAKMIHNDFEQRFRIDVGVVITDSHGRPFRIGNTGVAIGAAGLTTLRWLEGEPDLFGRALSGASIVPVADLIASAAMLVSGEAAEGTPVIILRGLPTSKNTPLNALPLIREPSRDMFAVPDRDYS